MPAGAPLLCTPKPPGVNPRNAPRRPAEPRTHDTPPAPPQKTQQIVVPDPAKERRIIDCNASYVDCKDEGWFGPCCKDKPEAAKTKA